jgi:diphthamide biosynthesis enzyme Dph1/Dph2-like protein
MKTLFINTSYKLDNFDSNLLNNLPESIALVYSIQFKNLAEKIKSFLSKSKEITLFSQVLGCSKIKFPSKTKAVLLISNGRFHAISLAYESGLPVYLFDNGLFRKIDKEEVEKISKSEKAATLNYLSSEKVGILVSTKPGQERLSSALKFKKSLKNKKSYLFLSNEINVNEFENFQLKSFVNTSCPRMDLVSSKLINLEKVLKL